MHSLEKQIYYFNLFLELPRTKNSIFFLIFKFHRGLMVTDQNTCFKYCFKHCHAINENTSSFSFLKQLKEQGLIKYLTSY